MKKILSIVICLAMMLSLAVIFASCGKTEYEIALVTDVGQLMDKGFNQGTWEGVEGYAKKPTNTISPLTALTQPTTTVSQL